MKREFTAWPCSLARSVDVFGDSWTLLLVRDAMHGLSRFDEFQRSLHIARNTLSDRLGKLVDAGIMVVAQELAHGPSIAHTATKRLVSVTVNEGLAAADEAMAEIQRPIIGSADFANAVRSYRENGIGMAEFEGR